jgi:tetratricopeptide (TPR) repeat protein
VLHSYTFRAAIASGVDDFTNESFDSARNKFSAVFTNAVDGSNEQVLAKTHLYITDAVTSGIELMNHDNFVEGRKKLKGALYEATETSMKKAIEMRLNELAESLERKALIHFQRGDWQKAQEFYEHAFMTCTSDFGNEQELKTRLRTLKRLNMINSDNEIDELIDVLSMTADVTMRRAISSRLTKAELRVDAMR